MKCLQSVAGFLLVFLVCQVRSAHADRARSEAWDGLSTLVELGGALGIAVQPTAHVDVSKLGQDSALLLIAPAQDLPAQALSVFLQNGGRVALFADEGAGLSFLDTFGIEPSPYKPGPDTPVLRANPQLPIARPERRHTLAANIVALAANHPATLRHPELDAAFAFRPGEALVLTGAVGRGRLLAGADEALLINQMLRVSGNRTFGRNLLAYLTEGGASRVLLVVDGASVEGGTLDPGGRGAVARLRRLIASVAGHLPGPAAVRVGTWALVVGLLAAAATALPRKGVYGKIHDPRRRKSSPPSQPKGHS